MCPAFGVTFGPPKSLKSFLLMHLGLHMYEEPGTEREPGAEPGTERPADPNAQKYKFGDVELPLLSALSRRKHEFDSRRARH